MPKEKRTLLCSPAIVKLATGEGEAHLERLRIDREDGTSSEEIRFSWWKGSRFIPRPLDLPEAQLMELLVKGIREGVLTLPLPANPN